MTDRTARVAAWIRPELRDLKPYYKAPLEGNPLRLDQNTNLAGPNPAIAKVDPTALDATQYPGRDADHLLAALADFHGLSPENFIAGNGGDELLEILVKAFGEPGSVLAVPAPTYSLYPAIAKGAGLRYKPVPTKGGFATLDVEALAATKPRMVWVANPNNPTGAGRAEILAVRQRARPRRGPCVSVPRCAATRPRAGPNVIASDQVRRTRRRSTTGPRRAGPGG